MSRIIDDSELMAAVEKSASAILIEPPYKRRYPPLGLMKLSTALKNNGASVSYSRKVDFQQADTFFVSSLFTYESEKVVDSIRQIRFSNSRARIIVGGVSATMNSDIYLNEGCDVFCGVSQYLDSFSPDYKTDWQCDEWSKFSFATTHRGCPRKCGYCFVKTTEPKLETIEWKHAVDAEKKYIFFYDSNVCYFGAGHVKSIADFAIENKKRVCFDSAIDCRFITPEVAAEIARIPAHKKAIRMSFDRISDDGYFQQAVENLRLAGVKPRNIDSFVLFNYHDSPREALYRAEECRKSGVNVVPNAYRPATMTKKSEKYVSEKWTQPLITAFRAYWWLSTIRNTMTFDEYLKRLGEIKHGFTDCDFAAWNCM